MNDQLNESILAHFNLPAQFINQNALTNTYYTYEKCEEIAKFIFDKVKINPLIAIVCGSGLGNIAELVENKQIISYKDIKDFPRSTVHGHKGNLVFGNLNSLPTVCMQGRFHPFEGYSPALCTLPIKIFKLLGVKMVILTNAAGGINEDYKVGDLMIIKDHMSFPLLSLSHPLVGPNDERFGPRFVPINNIYAKKYRDLFKECGKELSISLHEGIYGTIGGPTYETVTDSRFCKLAGMDCVGMSTTHEAVVATYCGLKVLAFSIVTDRVVLEYDVEESSDHAEIVKVANRKALDAEKLVSLFFKKIKEDQSLLD